MFTQEVGGGGEGEGKGKGEGKGEGEGEGEEGRRRDGGREGRTVITTISTVRRPYSLVPRLSWNVNMYRAENLVSFVRKHDISK